MKYAALIFGDDERQPKAASSKLSSPEPGQIIRSIDGSVYRVASKIAGPDGSVIKLASLQGEPAQTPLNFRPVSFAAVRLAAWLKYHLAHNRDFDLYINSYIEKYNNEHKENPLPFPVGQDGKAFRWANWFQKVVSPKLYISGHGDFEDQQVIKDELIGEMLFTVLGHRDVLSQFVAKAKSLKVNRQNGAVKLTDWLISTFMYRIDEMQNKFNQLHPEEEISMYQPGATDESEGEVNLLETEEYGVGEQEFQSAEARKDVAKFREGFAKWLAKPSVAGQKGGENFILMFDLFWRILQTDEDADVKRSDLEKEWMEKTGLSFGSFKDCLYRLPDMVEQFIMSHKTELGDKSIFIDLMNVIRTERERNAAFALALESEKGRKKERARPAMVSSLNTAGIEGDFAEAISNTENPDVVDPDIQQPTESVSEAGKQAGDYNPYATYDRLKKKYDDTHEVSYEGGRARVVKKEEKFTCMKCHRTSNASDSNNLQCPHCGGNMKTAEYSQEDWERDEKAQYDLERVEDAKEFEADDSEKTASTGLECWFFEYQPGKWYYLLEHGSSPKNAWDWREHSSAYGPFSSKEEAVKHLQDNHANPGGWGSSDHDPKMAKDKVLAKLVAEAEAPQQRQRYNRRWGSVNKVAQKLLRGEQLTPEMAKQVRDAFIYRWTSDNKRRGDVYHCDKCDVRNNPYVNTTSAEGHQHPTIPLTTDAEWLKNYAFYFTNANKLLPNMHAVPAYLAPESDAAPILASVAHKFAMEKAAYNPGKGEYIYQADVYCEPCGEALKRRLDKQGYTPANSDESSYDSDKYPKGPYYEQEADGPEHCARCGEFLENPLTDDGYRYLNEMIFEHEEDGKGQSEIIEEWKAFYPEREDERYTPGGEVSDTLDQVEQDTDKDFLREMNTSSKKAMLPHEFNNADGQAIRNETYPNTDYVSGEADTAEFRERRMGAGSNSGDDDARGVGDLYRENFYEHRTEGISSDGLMSGIKQAVDPSSILNVVPPRKPTPLHKRPQDPSGHTHPAETGEAEPGSWQCMDCGTVGKLDPKGGDCETCGSQAVFPVSPSGVESPELIRETSPIETEKRMIPRRSGPINAARHIGNEYPKGTCEHCGIGIYKPLPESGMWFHQDTHGERCGKPGVLRTQKPTYATPKTAQGAGNTTVTMQNQNATIPNTPGKAQPMAVPDAIDQQAGPHSPNAPNTAPRTPALQPRIVNVPSGTESEAEMGATASVKTGTLNEDDPACPKCGGSNIDIDETEEGYAVYCEDCERVTWTGVPSSIGEHAVERDFEEESEPQPPEEAPFVEHEAASPLAPFSDNAPAPAGELSSNTLPQMSGEEAERWLEKHGWVKENEHHGATWWMEKQMWYKKDEEEISYQDTDDAVEKELDLMERAAERSKTSASSNPLFQELDGVWTSPEAPTDEEIKILGTYLAEGSQVSSVPTGIMVAEKWRAGRFPMSGKDDKAFLKSVGIQGAAAAPVPPNVQQNMSIVKPQAPAGVPGATMAIMPGTGEGEEPGGIKRHTVEPELPNAKYHMQGALIASEEQRLTKQAFGVDTPPCTQCGETKPDTMWHEFPEFGDINDPTHQLEGFYCEDCALEIAQDI